ncbi:uncharacterized protein PG998_015231 [Apiospora kogelbergensis]|uniref:uncharacterized protein n=1 Tax=Apiospora kogelbergensis TaxID=1337665 RepID=UPI00312CEF62
MLSPTIRHAMGLTRAMDERYLWADALCIVQDDVQETRHQLLLMGKLYASATFTIVCTDGDGSEGIPGIQGISHPRNLYQVAFPLFASSEKVTIQDEGMNCYYPSTPSNYFRRAWTFQEYALSKRRLIVGKKTFHWICPSAAFCESTVSFDTRNNHLHEGQYLSLIRNTLSGRPCLKEFERVVRDYNGRNHSFPEDALAGVTGILEILSRSFEGGFIYGMPVMYFHTALMWSNVRPELAERRRHSGKDHSILQGSCLPSWSWLGWKDANINFNGNDGRLEDNSEVTVGIVQWSSHESATPSNLRPVGPSFPSTILDDTLKRGLAQGWTSQKSNRSNRKSKSSMVGDVVFQHSSMPGSLFWGWFPIKEHQSDLRPVTPPQHAFLSCKARRGWFRVEQKRRSLGSKNFEVFDMHEKYCGWLQLILWPKVKELPCRDSGQSQLVELVATCIQKRGYTNYGVLCIEWEDGVAYRKGVGGIYSEAWESHDLEDVDLILG